MTVGRPTKDNPRNEPMSFRGTDENISFVARVQQERGLNKSTAIWEIFECGQRFYFANCAKKSSDSDE